MATTPSWLSCLKPHISWVFGQLRHFNFFGPGATHRGPVPGHSSRERRFGAAGFSERRWPKSPRSGSVTGQDKPPSCVPQGRVPPRKLGGDKEKFCQLFQKLRGVEQRSTALRGVRDRRSCLPIHKKGGTDVPLLGCHRGRCPRAWNKKVVKYFKKLGNMRVLFYTRVVKYLARW